MHPPDEKKSPKKNKKRSKKQKFDGTFEDDEEDGELPDCRRVKTQGDYPNNYIIED